MKLAQKLHFEPTLILEHNFETRFKDKNEIFGNLGKT
jgi:hypothetical protein